jgi:NAD(P)H dehydrogenase (quinone)
MADVADAVSAATGRQVAVREVSPAEYRRYLLDNHLPEQVADMLVDIDRALAQDELLVTGGTLSRLAGRPTTSVHDAFAEAVAQLPG